MGHADLEVTTVRDVETFVDDLPSLPAVIAHEPTDEGWRGLTADGDVFNIAGHNGNKVAIPESLLITRDGKAVGRREVRNDGINIAEYLQHHDRGVELFRANECSQALAEFEAAIAIAPTARARFNMGLVLLTLGRWQEGIKHHEARLELLMPWTCKEIEQQGVPRWDGLDIAGSTLLLVHDAGFGDTIMLLRCVRRLKHMGVNVRIMVPPELQRLAEQFAPLAKDAEGADYYCPLLSLFFLLQETPETIPNASYLKTDPVLVQKWRNWLGKTGRRVGVAWSVGKDVNGDYPRSIPLALLDDAIGDADVYSVQSQGVDEASALGIARPQFEDLADCAAFMSLMDEIVTVDTAAAHIAGAIGHPRTTVLLSYWHSWRWRLPLYAGLKFCVQPTPGDWTSAVELWKQSR
jgi:hypothetical protein